MTDASKEFLDNSQYTEAGVLKYEFIFGEGFISTGGVESTKAIFDRHPIKNGAKVLDIGSGIGGGAKYLSDRFEADVLGIDLASHCVEIANRRFTANPRLTFVVADALTKEYPDNYFDLIYSRDTILHVASKLKLFTRLLNATAIGGKLVITDYCCGEKSTWDAEFSEYVNSRGYSLLTVQEYADVLKKSGWTVEVAEDQSDWFAEILKAEKDNAMTKKANFVKSFADADFDGLVRGWDNKLSRVAKGCQKWGLFICKREG